MLKYWYISHDNAGAKRVWLDGWAGDMFQVVPKCKFMFLQELVANTNRVFQEMNLGQPIQLQEVPDSE
jgi:hypothetical protein